MKGDLKGVYHTYCQKEEAVVRLFCVSLLNFLLHYRIYTTSVSHIARRYGNITSPALCGCAVGNYPNAIGSGQKDEPGTLAASYGVTKLLVNRVVTAKVGIALSSHSLLKALRCYHITLLLCII